MRRLFLTLVFLAVFTLPAFAQTTNRIIILNLNPSVGGEIRLNVAFWYLIPVNRRVVVGSIQSAWSGATSQNLTDIGNGSILEDTHRYTFPVSYTKAQIQTILETFYNDRKTYLISLPFQGQNFGVIWDGTTWTP